MLATEIQPNQPNQSETLNPEPNVITDIKVKSEPSIDLNTQKSDQHEESVRMQKLQKAFDFALSSIFKDCSLSEIQQTLTQLNKDNPRLLEQEYFKFKDNFIQLSKWEFDQLLMKLQLSKLLKEVDEFKEGIISNDPMLIINSKRFNLKKQEKERLNKLLSQVFTVDRKFK